MTTFNPATEIRFLYTSLDQLQAYLLSDELFWNIGRDRQLTLGNLLLAAAYLAGLEQLPEGAHEELNTIKEEWRSAWEKKAAREFGARLRQWTSYLRELRQQPEQHAAYYPTEVRVRVLLELLHGETPDLASEELDLLNSEDRVIQGLLSGKEFQWDEGAQRAFPKEPFWFLYGRPDGR